MIPQKIQPQVNIPADAVTQEMINGWKAQFEPEGRTVHRITAGDKKCYIASPDRKTISFATAAGATDPLKFNEIILKEGWLAGDMEIQTNVGKFLSVGKDITAIIGMVETTLEKL